MVVGARADLIGAARSRTIARPAGAGAGEYDCAVVGLVIGSRASAAAFSRALRSPTVPIDPVGYPPDSERVPKVSRGSGRAQGEAGGSVSPGTLPAADVGAMPTWHRNSLGVGRVARRARLVIKPNENRLPRLTLKAGSKEGLPTNPTAACGAMSPSVRAVPYLNECIPMLSIIKLCILNCVYI